MQWPDTTVGAAGAAGFEAEEAGSVAVPTAEVRSRSGPAPGGVASLSDRVAAPPGGMSGTVGLPTGIDLPCRGDPDLFFAEVPEDVERAKAICRGCQARIACLTGALERREPLGVWGGELFVHGSVVPRKRPRGRPRKTEVAA